MARMTNEEYTLIKDCVLPAIEGSYDPKLIKVIKDVVLELEASWKDIENLENRITELEGVIGDDALKPTALNPVDCGCP